MNIRDMPDGHEMDAGKEMDELIAKALGLPLTDGNPRNNPMLGSGGRIRYSEGIAAAFEVVDKMAELGHDFDLFYHSGFEMPWVARFPVGVDNPDSHKNNTAKTAPLAICKAALRAVVKVGA